MSRGRGVPAHRAPLRPLPGPADRGQVGGAARHQAAARGPGAQLPRPHGPRHRVQPRALGQLRRLPLSLQGELSLAQPSSAYLSLAQQLDMENGDSTKES